MHCIMRSIYMDVCVYMCEFMHEVGCGNVVSGFDNDHFTESTL